MKRRFGHGSPVGHARGFRRAALIVLAFVYLFVGIAHQVACLDQAVAASFAVTNVADNGDGKVVPPVCDHCPTCSPGVMPVMAVAADPAAVPVRLVVATVPLRMEDHPRLDTPPPKHLI